MNQNLSFRHLSDSALTAEVLRVAASERHLVTRFVSLLVEFDRRRLHLALGYNSLFDYCVKVLKLTEHETYNRIEAARAVRRYPILLDKLKNGGLSLTAIRLLAPHLTAANCGAVIEQASGKNTEGIKMLVAKLKPQPAVPSVVRKLPALKPAAAPAEAATTEGEQPVALAELLAAPTPPPSRRPVVAPLSETHYKLQVTISSAGRERLKQIQDLMRHRIPSGDPAAIVEHALEVLHVDLLKKKAAEVVKPRKVKNSVDPKSRHIPASVKREVWERDEGRCAFTAADGTRCRATGLLEYHHVDPYWLGGEASAANIQLRCSAHNRFEWEKFLEPETVGASSG